MIIWASVGWLALMVLMSLRQTCTGLHWNLTGMLCLVTGQEDLKRTATLPTERSFRSWFRSASARRPYTLVAV